MAACVGLCIALVACSHQQAPAYSVQDKPFPPSARTLNLAQIDAQIEQAAVAKGWKVEKIKPGELRVSIEWSSHSTVETIQFTQRTYSIRHHSSVNLREKDGYIHRQRNVRVQQLEEEIDRRLKFGAT